MITVVKQEEKLLYPIEQDPPLQVKDQDPEKYSSYEKNQKEGITVDKEIKETLEVKQTKKIRRKEGTQYVEEDDDDEEEESQWKILNKEIKPNIPFWFGREAEDEMRRTCQRYATYLRLKNNIYNKNLTIGEEKTTRAPKSYIGYINRIIVHPDLKCDQITKLYAIKELMDVEEEEEDEDQEYIIEMEDEDEEMVEGRRSPIITFDYNFAVSPTHREQLYHKFPEINERSKHVECTSVDLIKVYSKADTHLGAVLAPDSTHYCTTTWNADGDPIEIRGLRKDRYERFLELYEEYRIELEDYEEIETTITCEPYFEGIHFKYSCRKGNTMENHTYAGLHDHMIAKESKNILKHRRACIPDFSTDDTSERPKSSSTAHQKTPPKQLQKIIVDKSKRNTCTLSPDESNILAMVNRSQSPVYDYMDDSFGFGIEDEEDEPLVIDHPPFLHPEEEVSSDALSEDDDDDDDSDTDDSSDDEC